tara:strand:- start:3765 stop:4010 length:246 start_codon:yes stop_codon:yes gene_type:complete
MMPAIHVDQDQAIVETVSATDTDGSEINVEGFVIPTVIPLSEVGPWLALYDPTSGTSPSAANSRIIARAVLDALIAAAEAT